MLPAKSCRLCQGPIISGRFDKIFCSIECKNTYHVQLRRATDTDETVIRIDRILRRNRSILFELMGEKRRKMKIPKIELDKKKFNYSYFTHTHLNKEGKTYFFAFDFGWMAFSDQDVLLVRRKRK